MKKILLLLMLLIMPEIGFGYYVWHPCCKSCNRLGGWWASADYLMLWRKKRFYPPLVTTNPTVPPVLGAPGTEILFGDERIGRSPTCAGFKVDAGLWLDCCFGVGGGGYNAGNEKIKFKVDGRNGVGEPFLGRPFFAAGVPSVDLISGTLLGATFTNGKIEIDAVNRNWGADLYGRLHLLHRCSYSLDFLAGLYFNQLVDNINITTQTRVTVVTPLPLLPEVIRVNDQFNTTNNFCGALLGGFAEYCWSCWAVRATLKLGIGCMEEKVKIKGSTIHFTGADLGTITIDRFGLLSQGVRNQTHHKFEVIPEFHGTVQLKVWAHLWLTAGYFGVYLPSVVLAGEQIDLNIPSVNRRLKETSFWLQGLTAGVYMAF